MSNRNLVKIGQDLKDSKARVVTKIVNSLYWYDKAMWDLYYEVKNYRMIEALTGIPFGTCYTTIKKIKDRVQFEYIKFLNGQPVKNAIKRTKKASSLNETKMFEYLHKSKRLPGYSIQTPAKNTNQPKEKKVTKVVSFRVDENSYRAARDLYGKSLNKKVNEFIKKLSIDKTKTAHLERVDH